jgi:carbon storage regulator CsrA
MLILTRHVGEGVTVNLGDGSKIHIQVMDIQAHKEHYLNNKQVKMGIKAPKNIHIVRDELLGVPHYEKFKNPAHNEEDDFYNR